MCVDLNREYENIDIIVPMLMYVVYTYFCVGELRAFISSPQFQVQVDYGIFIACVQILNHFYVLVRVKGHVNRW